MQFCVYSRKYRDVMAAYGRQLAPYYDRWACMEKRAAVINLETVGDFWELWQSIGQPVQVDGNRLMICDAPPDLDAYMHRQ